MTEPTETFHAVMTGDQDAVRRAAADLAAAFAADSEADAAWSRLPALQWAAEQTALTGYARLYNAALPAHLAPAAAAPDPDLPADLPGAWAARLDPALDAERRTGLDELLADAVADARERHGHDTPEPLAEDPTTVFPPGFMPALTRLRAAALPVPPLFTGALDAAPAAAPETADADRPARPLAELVDALLEVEDLEWRRPATARQIARLEASTGVELPAGYRAFLERVNGSMDREFAGCHEVVADAKELLEYAEEELADADDPDAARAAFTNDDGSGRVAPGGFVRGWLPVYDHGTGAFVLLDCAPGPQGTAGRVLEYGDGETRVTHPDFRAWLQDHVEELEGFGG